MASFLCSHHGNIISWFTSVRDFAPCRFQLARHRDRIEASRRGYIDELDDADLLA
jgi:hypothetical protein